MCLCFLSADQNQETKEPDGCQALIQGGSYRGTGVYAPPPNNFENYGGKKPVYQLNNHLSQYTFRIFNTII